MPQHRAAGQLGRTPHCLEPTPTPAAAAKRFLFAAGAGLGFTFAALMSITNLASALSDNVGALLYQHVFISRLAPLILVSAVFTAFAWILIPLLRLGDKPQGRAIAH